jgi:1-acyl-sn-glycerol-3-phosphate acyltransferase
MSSGLRRGFAFSRAVLRGINDFKKQQRASGGTLGRPERAQWLHRMCSAAMKSLDIHLQHEGIPPTAGLIVSNHLSYVDILCFSALAPCIFVSKDDVRGWPLFGDLATRGGTIYVNRNSKADAHRATIELEETLRSGLRVVLFPEGTSTDGSKVLRFHAPFFEAAVKSGAPITPAAIGYEIEGGDPAQDVCYWGDMTFGPHFLGILRKGAIHARIRFGETRTALEDRKSASLLLHDDVVELHHELKRKYSGMGADRSKVVDQAFANPE